ncbi:MAG: T9SS type A sorting domain-containing protein [Bacteroidota bacterium]
MKRKIIFHLVLLNLSGILFPQATHAQIDIRLEIQNNEAVISLVSDRIVQGVVSNLQFTLAWENTPSLLGGLQQPLGPDVYLPAVANDSLLNQGNKYYQIFTAFGLERLSASGAQWSTGDVVEILRIPLNGQALTLQIAEDTFATSQNGGFYLELDGVDVTGNIQNILLSVAPYDQSSYISNLRVFPNPATDVVQARFHVQHRIPVRWRLLNQEGKQMAAASIQAEEGQNQFSVKLTNFPKGIYVLYIQSDTFADAKKLIIK